MIKCTSCEGDLSEPVICHSWYEFYEHCYVAHPSERLYIRQVPFNISGRTKKQIVSNAEQTYLQEWII